MAAGRRIRTQARRFTLDQLRDEPTRVLVAAKQTGGVVVVDKQGAKRFSLWIPQEPVD